MTFLFPNECLSFLATKDHASNMQPKRIIGSYSVRVEQGVCLLVCLYVPQSDISEYIYIFQVHAVPVMFIHSTSSLSLSLSRSSTFSPQSAIPVMGGY